MEKPYYHWRWAAQENFCGKIAGIYGVKPAVQSVAVKTNPENKWQLYKKSKNIPILCTCK